MPGRAVWRSSVIILLLWIVLVTSACRGAIPIGNRSDITVYSALPPDLVQKYLAEFEEEYPDIRVTLVNDGTLDLTNRLLAESENPKADVIWGLAVTSMLQMEWDYLLQLYAPEGLERIAPLFRDTNNPPMWVPMTARSIVFCVNPAELEALGLEMPDTWQDLTRDEYQGHIVMPDPGRSSLGYLYGAAILQIFDQIRGWEVLEEIHDNVGQYTANVVQVCPLVADGTYPIGISYDSRAAQQAGSDEPVTVIFPGEGTGWESEVNALVRKERIKPAAKVFLDWAISDGAMQQYESDQSIIAAELDTPNPDRLISNVATTLLDQDIPWIAANRDQLQREWVETFGSNFEPAQFEERQEPVR